jgi:hypothetical protein
LAERLVALQQVGTLSDETMRRTLKKQTQAVAEKACCMPSVDAN